MRLKDKVVVIVGASGAIGQAVTKKVYDEGATVVLAARGVEKLTALAQELGSERVHAIVTDASNYGAVVNLFDMVIARCGRIDAIVISVGTHQFLYLDDTPAHADELFRKHYQGILLPASLVSFIGQQYLRRQGPKGEGMIIHLSSHAAVRADLPNNYSYSPAKAAVTQLMRCLRRGLSEGNVKVFDLLPAIVNTPDNTKFLDTPEKQAKAIQPEDIGELIVKIINHPEGMPMEQLLKSAVEI